MSRIGETIKNVRVRKGLTPKALAKKLGVSESFLLEVESGKKIINESLMKRLTKALGVDLNQDISFYAQEEESKPSAPASQPLHPHGQQKTPKNNVPVAPQWEQAFSNVLKDIPVYDGQMSKVLEVRKLPVIDGKVEGFPPDKAFYILTGDSSMKGFRLNANDRVLVHTVGDIGPSGLYLIQVKGIKMIRQVKKLDERSLLLISHDASLHTETANIHDVMILGQCVKAEISL